MAGKNHRSLSARVSSSSQIKIALYAAALGILAQRALRWALLPYGGARVLHNYVLEYDSVDPSVQTLFAVTPDGKPALTKVFEKPQTHHLSPDSATSTNSTKSRKSSRRASRLLKGSETVVVHPLDGTVYAVTEDAILLRLDNISVVSGVESSESSPGPIANTAYTSPTVVADLGRGRPLGGAFTKDGSTLYIADAINGLLRVKFLDDDKSNNKNSKKIRVQQPPSAKQKTQVEIISSRVSSSAVADTDEATCSDGPKQSSLYGFANDVAIGPVTGRVFFTDSTEILPDRIGTGYGGSASPHWDTLYASKHDLLRSHPTGRLLRYDPSNGETTVIFPTPEGISNPNLNHRPLLFANGVSVASSDERFLVVAETFALRLWLYDLYSGTLSLLLDNRKFVGYPDGVDCVFGPSSPSTSSITTCYMAIPSAVVPAHMLVSHKWLPPPVSVMLRTILMMLPRQLSPPVKDYGGVMVVEFDPLQVSSGNHDSTKVTHLQDPHGKHISLITGVTHYNNKLYLGSLQNDYIAIFDLKSGPAQQTATTA
jgi:sugar lactone lactonase YvrE